MGAGGRGLVWRRLPASGGCLVGGAGLGAPLHPLHPGLRWMRLAQCVCSEEGGQHTPCPMHPTHLALSFHRSYPCLPCWAPPWRPPEAGISACTNIHNTITLHSPRNSPQPLCTYTPCFLPKRPTNPGVLPTRWSPCLRWWAPPWASPATRCAVSTSQCRASSCEWHVVGCTWCGMGWGEVEVVGDDGAVCKTGDFDAVHACTRTHATSLLSPVRTHAA